MDDQDRAGIFVATVATALLAGAWVWAPPSWATAGVQGLEQASQQALEMQSAGQPMLWHGDGGTLAAITPSSTFRDGSGRWCRPYSVVVDGIAAPPRDQYVGCRDNTGQWTISALGTASAAVLVAQVN